MAPMTFPDDESFACASARRCEEDLACRFEDARTQAYLAEFGRYVALASTPQAMGVIGLVGFGNEKMPWPPCPNPVGAFSPGHCILGWQPDGSTYYNYAVSLSPAANSFSAAARLRPRCLLSTGEGRATQRSGAAAGASAGGSIAPSDWNVSFRAVASRWYSSCALSRIGGGRSPRRMASSALRIGTSGPQ